MSEHEPRKHKAWNVFVGLVSAATAGFLLIRSLKAKTKD